MNPQLARRGPRRLLCCLPFAVAVAVDDQLRAWSAGPAPLKIPETTTSVPSNSRRTATRSAEDVARLPSTAAIYRAAWRWKRKAR